MLTENSASPVRSSQTGIHRRLAERVLRHLQVAWKPVLPAHTQQAFATVAELVGQNESSLILDSGCGTGQSTRLIAAHNPDALVIGLDKSAVRLQKACPGPLPQREGNILWLRAELAGFWHLAARAGWRLRAHFLLYPNPWPKPGQLKRRWHAHPVFPDLLRLGGTLELRTNWRIYAEEFASAVGLVSGYSPPVRTVTESDITTAFERKYQASGHELFSVVTPPLTDVPVNPRPVPLSPAE